MKDKREDILKATIRLLNAEGIGISTARIAKEAGVSNGTLFNYFATKSKLLDAVFLAIKGEWASVLTQIDLNETVENIVRQNWRLYYTWAMENRAENIAMNLLLESGLISEAAKLKADEGFEMNRLLMQEAMDAGVIVKMSPHILTQLFMAQINVAITNSLSVQESEQLCDAFWRGVST